MKYLRTSAVIAALVALLATAGLAVAQESTEDTPDVVVTTDVLGAIVTELLGDAASVEILMDGGVDPHSWQPSARDVASVFDADLVVANGLGLEEGLADVLREAGAAGTTVFTATDYVEVIDGDPHFWLDPLAMRDVATALVAASAAAGISTADDGQVVIDGLTALDAAIAADVAAIPEAGRQLVTGHDALSYFARRYGFEIIGAVVPGVSSAGEASARDLAELIDAIEAAGATTIFTDVGTPQAVAASISSDSGAAVVELDVATIPADGTYADLVLAISDAIAGALGD